MPQILTRDFQFSRDFRSISWKDTIWYNGLRAFCAGITFTLISLIVDNGGVGGARGIGTVLALPFFWPVAYVFFAIPIGLFCAFLSKAFPIAGLITLILSVMWVVIGDPLVWLLKLVAPKIVPVQSTSFVNLALIMWVLKSEHVSEIIHHEERNAPNGPKKVNRI